MFRMIISAAKVAIVLALCVFTTSAVAQKIHPDCMQMRNKIGCTCALENGGGIRPPLRGHTEPRWFSRQPGNRHVNDGFVQCMKRHGKSASIIPTSIVA